MSELLDRLKHLRLYSSALFLSQGSARCSTGLVISRVDSMAASIELTQLLAEKVDAVVGALEQVEALKVELEAERKRTERQCCDREEVVLQLRAEVERRRDAEQRTEDRGIREFDLSNENRELKLEIEHLKQTVYCLEESAKGEAVVPAFNYGTWTTLKSLEALVANEVERRELLESLIDEDHDGHRKTCACPLCTGYEAYIERYKEKP